MQQTTILNFSAFSKITNKAWFSWESYAGRWFSCNIMPYFCLKLGKMLQNLSSAAVLIGALSVNSQWLWVLISSCTYLQCGIWVWYMEAILVRWVKWACALICDNSSSLIKSSPSKSAMFFSDLLLIRELWQLPLSGLMMLSELNPVLKQTKILYKAFNTYTLNNSN